MALGALLPASAAIAQQGEAPKPGVVIAPVVNEKVATSQVFIGNIEAIQEVELRARVEGFLEKVAFKEGQMVTAGDLLYQIEQAQYQASLEGAQAQEAEAQAALLSSQAQAEDTQAEFERQAQLLTRGNTSQARFDQAKAARDQAKASVSQSQAQIASAKSDIDTAKLNLSYTQVTSPIAGKIGKTAVTEGNLVDPSTGVLATVVQLDPIRVVFSISDAEYVEVTEQLLKDNVQPGTQVYSFALTLPTGKPYEHQGTFAFVDNQVDPATGTIAIRADFPNPQQLLVPGQFVRVTTSETQAKTLPVVPTRAVQQDTKGRYVFVLGKDDRAERRDITVGEQTKDGWAVEGGLVAGEMVIVEGIQKIHNGLQVTPTRAPNQPAASGTQGAGAGGQSSGQGDGQAAPSAN
ncbi:MAG: multidrug efflux RND transporter periplasmic adaptor subunit VmeY [Rhodospirillales bacterium]